MSATLLLCEKVSNILHNNVLVVVAVDCCCDVVGVECCCVFEALENFCFVWLELRCYCCCVVGELECCCVVEVDWCCCVLVLKVNWDHIEGC